MEAILDYTIGGKRNIGTVEQVTEKKSETYLNYTMWGIVSGLIFVIISWTFSFIYGGYKSFSTGILYIHTETPLIFLIDLLPFFLGFAGYYFSEQINNVRDIYADGIESRNKLIKSNANLAKMIGKDEFNERIKKYKRTDELSKSLILLHQNLIESSKKEEELNWIARGKDLISNILRQHNVIDVLAYETLVNIIKYINAIQGAFYIFDDEKKKLTNVASYAYNRRKYLNQVYEIGQGLIGQAAYEMDIIYRKEIPADYVTISSGIIGDAKPQTILIVPLIGDEKLQGVIELASLESDIPDLTLKFVKELGNIIGQTIFNLKANIRTEKLLKDAQIMTRELKANEETLKRNAEEMAKTQKELEESNKNLEAKIVEAENAQKRLHSLLENASEIISIIGEDELLKYESPSVKRILGYQPEDVIGKNTFDEVYKEAGSKLRKIFTQLLLHPDTPQTVQYQYKRDENEVLWLETTGRNLLSDPAINGVIFNTRDITVRKIAEKAQRMSGQMQALSENSPDMIVRLGVEGEFFYVNPVVEQFTGVITNDIINKTLLEVSIDPKIIDFFTETLEKVSITKEKLNTETVFPSLTGKRVMQVNAIPEFNEENELESVLLVAHDITEIKMIEEEIREKNKNINDSINYATRIQSALLPDNKYIREYLPNSFIFFKPKESISGDFPWFFKKDDIIYIAAIDCTGHGVPGALLTFVGYFLLNNIVDHANEQTTSGEILDHLHIQVRKTLKQDRDDSNTRDGMDIAFCKVNIKKREIEYAGAHRPLYYLRSGQITQYKGNHKAIGGISSTRRAEKDFTTHTINYEIGDKVFFFSDGLTDQIGGSKGRKYQASRIRDILSEHPDYSMIEYSRFFIRDFNQWKGEHKQIDDVILVGIEF